MKPNRLSMKKHTLRFAVILSALVLAGCASTQSTTSSTSASSASSTVSTVSTSEESGADETDSTGGAMNGTIGSVIEANLSFKNKDFYIDYSTEDTVKIDLSAPKEADGVKVSGSTVTITEAGTYVLSGTLTDGQIIIDVGDEDDVRLVLENASITCTTTAPIYAKNADKVIISLPENTESTVTDTVTGTDGNDALTAAIFAKCDLSVNGTGTLNVNANANDGITSEDKLKITGGVLNITSADDGLVGKDAVLIKDGTVHITASGNGIKSTKSEADQGYVYIGGGTANITAEQDGIQAETSVLISAGEVNVTAGGGANGEQKTGNAMFGGAQSTTTDETLSTKGIKAEAALDITGGTVTVDSADDSLHSNDSMTVSGGGITVKSGDDGLHADNTLTIEDGTIVVEESCEGLEAIDLTINGGTIDVTASDDGLNAAGSSVDGGFGTAGADTLTVNGGTLTVNASGDGLDSNGALTINGGTVYVSGPTGDGNGTFDCDGVFTINGGVVLGTGSSGMLKTPTTDSKQNTISVSCTGSAGDTVEVKGADGNTLVSAVAPKSFTNVTFSTLDITEGETYTVYVNGTEAASETCSGVVSGATGMGSFGGGPGNMGGRAPNGGMGGQMPNGNSDGTTPPEMPSGDSGITPPNGNGGTPPQMPGNTSDT